MKKGNDLMICLGCKTPLPGNPYYCPGCGKKMNYPDDNKNNHNKDNKLLKLVKGAGSVLILIIGIIGIIGASIIAVGAIGFFVLIMGGAVGLAFAIVAYSFNLPGWPMFVFGFIVGGAGILFWMFGVKREDKKGG